MPDISLIIKELGKKDMILNVDSNCTVNDLINKVYKNKCISNRNRDNYEFVFNGNELQPSIELLNKLSIKNLSQIEMIEKGNNNMKRGKDDWRDGIIIGSQSLVYNSIEEEIFIRKSLEEKVSKKIKNRIYCATQDGDTATVFHSKCDNKGALLYVIKTKNNLVFGIYISKPICSDGITRTDSTQMVMCPHKNFCYFKFKW